MMINATIFWVADHFKNDALLHIQLMSLMEMKYEYFIYYLCLTGDQNEKCPFKVLECFRIIAQI